MSDNQKYLIDLSKTLIVGEEKDKFLIYLKLMWALLISFCPMLFRLKDSYGKNFKNEQIVRIANSFAFIFVIFT